MIAAAAAILILTAAACADHSSPAGSGGTPENISEESSPADVGPAETSADKAEGAGEDTLVIGVCQSAVHPATDEALRGFEDYLVKEMGEKIAFLVRDAENDPGKCQTIIRGFQEEGAALILADGTAALREAQSSAKNSAIPVLGISSLDFSSALQENAGADTGGGSRVSGVSGAVPLEKQAALFTELLPEVKKIGILYCSGEYQSVYQAQHIRRYLEEAGFLCRYHAYADADELPAVTQEAVQRNDALYIPSDNTAAVHAGTIDMICREGKTPVIAAQESICQGCGIAALAPSWYELGSFAGQMAVSILRDGEDISKMEVKFAAYFRKIYVSSRCSELGINVPGYYIEAETAETGE